MEKQIFIKDKDIDLIVNLKSLKNFVAQLYEENVSPLEYVDINRLANGISKEKFYYNNIIDRLNRLGQKVIYCTYGNSEVGYTIYNFWFEGEYSKKLLQTISLNLLYKLGEFWRDMGNKTLSECPKNSHIAEKIRKDNRYFRKGVTKRARQPTK